MKKLFAILMMICYLIPSIGIKVNQHFCGKHLASTTFGDIQNPPCGCGKKSMKTDCCKDVKSFVKISDYQETSAKCTIAPFLEFYTNAPHIWMQKTENNFLNTIDDCFIFHPPPPKNCNAKLYIQHQALLI